MYNLNPGVVDGKGVLRDGPNEYIKSKIQMQLRFSILLRMAAR